MKKIFYNFKFIILFALLLVMNYLTLASEDDTKAFKISTDAYNYDKGFGDFTSDSKMTLRNKQGEETIRNFRGKTLEVDGDGDKTLFIFDSPKDVKGTATEQLVGLGVPALSLPGKGPQFTRGFALRQSRLLGGAVIPCLNAKQLAKRMEVLLQNDSLRNSLGKIGARRMGLDGGSVALAKLIIKFLLL